MGSGLAYNEKMLVVETGEAGWTIAINRHKPFRFYHAENPYRRFVAIFFKLSEWQEN
ncbi:MAG: hypothetical protein R3C01_09930 [Planctomycetaceae bacterium]